MDREEVLAQLDQIKRLRDDVEDAKQAVSDATEATIVDALKAGIGPTEIAAHAGVSDSHVRAVRRMHGLPANPSYAHLNPAANAQRAAANLTDGVKDAGIAAIRANAALDQLHATLRDST